MAERKHLTEEQIRIQYANYEKRASWTLEQIMNGVKRLYFLRIYSLFLFLGIILVLILRSAAVLAVCFLVGIVAGIAAGKLKVYKLKNAANEAGNIERSEGYTQRFSAEAKKHTDGKETYQASVTIALT